MASGSQLMTLDDFIVGPLSVQTMEANRLSHVVDPPERPYDSKYAARDIINEIRTSLIDLYGNRTCIDGGHSVAAAVKDISEGDTYDTDTYEGHGSAARDDADTYEGHGSAARDDADTYEGHGSVENSNTNSLVSDEVEKMEFNHTADKVSSLAACLDLMLGCYCMDTEEYSLGEKYLNNAVSTFEMGSGFTPTYASVYMNALNQLGILWSYREEPKKSQIYLARAESLYIFFHTKHLSPPMRLLEALGNVDATDDAKNLRAEYFDSLYTLTLFYFAQIYRILGDHATSAQYCQQTLIRQLNSHVEFDPMSWACHSVSLVDYYVHERQWKNASLCLAAAEKVFPKLTPDWPPYDNGDDDNSMDESDVIKYAKRADMHIAWGHYHLVMLQEAAKKITSEKNSIENAGLIDGEIMSNIADISMTEHDKALAQALTTLHIDSEVERIPTRLATNFEEAKRNFTAAKSWFDKALCFYRLDGYVTSHVSICQYISQLYCHMTAFEVDLANKARMTKRRIDILKPLSEQLSPQYYLNYVRQLKFELGETYATMHEIKTRQSDENLAKGMPNESAKDAALGKRNWICNCTIKSFLEYIGTFCDRDGVPQKQFDDDNVRPILLARLYVGQFLSKIVIIDDPASRVLNLQMSLTQYRMIIDYADLYPEITERVFGKELALTRELVKYLPASLS